MLNEQKPYHNYKVFSHMTYIKNIIRILCVLLIGLLCYATYIHTPEAYKPWVPIDLKDDINFVTSFKISPLKSDFELCQKALSTIDADYTALLDRQAGECELDSQINLEKSLYPYSAPVRARCAVIASLILWEDKVVARAADAYLDSDVARIRHYGTFSCRNIQGSSRRSQHASANAIDIAAFTLENGQTISVLRDWGKDTAEGRFLEAVRDGACGVFSSVLGPEYNDLHADHFHLDLGPYQICR